MDRSIVEIIVATLALFSSADTSPIVIVGSYLNIPLGLNALNLIHTWKEAFIKLFLMSRGIITHISMEFMHFKNLSYFHLCNFSYKFTI